MNSNVNGSVVVVTGGSSGIGLALAKRLLSLGAEGVVITGRNEERLDKAVQEITKELADEGKNIKGIPRILGVPCDAASWEDNLSLMKTTNDTFGRIDYVFANALGSSEEPKPYNLFSKPSFSDSYGMIDSVAYTVHAAVPYLASSTSTPVNNAKEKPAGGPGRDKAVILTSSEAAFVEYDPYPQYGVAKSGYNAFTFSLKSRLASLGIRVNCFSPGWVETNATKGLLEMGVIERSDFIPMKTVLDALVRLVNNSTLSGVITRIPTNAHLPFDVVAPQQIKVTLAHWEPFLAKLDQAWSGGSDKS